MTSNAVDAAAATAASASLAVNVATLQADLIASGGLDNASSDQLAALLSDATAALVSANAAAAANEGMLASMGGSGVFVSGTSAVQTTANVGLLIASASGAALAHDTVNRLTRLQDNILAIGT
jgi:hypothetical protein